MSAQPTAPNLPTIKRLFAKSGDRCAFHNCATNVVIGKTIVADICHIKAASPSGPRYDPNQTSTERHAFENLVLLCAIHHRVVDDDPERYTVAVIEQMKRDHEAKATVLAPEIIESAAKLLAEQIANADPLAVLQSADQIAPARSPAGRQELIARAAAFHSERLARITAGQGVVPVMDGGLFVFHIVPFASLDVQQSPSFSDISENPQRYPPVATERPRDCKISFDGLLVGSNAEGLSKPQRAYTNVFRSGIVETVVSSLARGREHNFLMLPQIQAALIKYVSIYMRALNVSGVTPPAVVCASLAGVGGMRLLVDFISTAIPEDIPGPRLDRDQYNFAAAVLDAVPAGIVDAANRLKPTLDHLANAANLSVSPYFDATGTYTLTP